MLSRKGSASLVGLALLALTPAFAQIPELDRLVGKDLWKMRGSQSDLRRLDGMLGEIPRGHVSPPSAWRIWKTGSDRKIRYVVVLGEPLPSIPGESTARIQLLDASGATINGWSFQAGWRLFLDEALIDFSTKHGGDLVVLKTTPAINGRNVAKQYFAIGDDRVRLVRIESNTGEAVQNEYVYPNREIGLAPEANNADQFIALLSSSDKADVLCALVYLGGRHLVESRRELLGEPRESKYAGLFREVINNPRVRTLIGRLAESDDEWVRQEAKLALREPRERFFE